MEHEMWLVARREEQQEDPALSVLIQSMLHGRSVKRASRG